MSSDVSTDERRAGRVLLLDDEDAIRDDLVDSLSQKGFSIEGERDADRALERLAREPFDVLLADLPTVGESAVIRQAIESSPGLSVILMAEEITNETSIVADELGALFCLAKPVETTVLLRALSSVISRHSQPTEGMARTARVWAETVGATAAKNEFSRVLELAVHGGPVRITKHRKPRAVLVSIDEYEELFRSTRNPLEKLSSEFDALLAQMQQPDAVAAMDGLFDASPDELGRAAVAGAKVSD